MPRFDVLELKKYLPARALTALKPYYRKFFPNRLIVMMNPTFRCNYTCSYCPIVTKFPFTSVVGKAGEVSGDKWLEGLEKLPPAAICFIGGEPFVYADLPTIINRWPHKHHLLAITTNLSQPENVYRKIKGRVKLIASLHREFIEPQPFVAKVRKLSDQFQIHVNIVATAENLPHLEMISNEFKELDVTLHVDPLVDVGGFHYTPEQMLILRRYIHSDRKVETQLDYNDYSPKRCSAGRNYVTLAPDGSVYTCQGGMSFIHSTQFTELVGNRNVSQFRLRNLFDPEFQLNAQDLVCSMPCNTACDRDSAIIVPIKNVQRVSSGASI
jgi:MoaA/NifB/PqqE/SkfB family radical SAM enzyme